MNTEQQTSIEVSNMQRVINCLALELHESIWKDVNAKWQELLKTIQSNTINEPIKEQADRYAERVCNGSFPITYSREQVVKHTSNDYLQGASDFKKYVLGVLSENYNASKNLTDEDKIRPSNDMVNETYQDLIAIFTNPSKLNTEKPEPIKDEELKDKIELALNEFYRSKNYTTGSAVNDLFEISKQYAASQINNTVEDKWISVDTPPKEGGRYWCYVEEVNDLGISHYQWNCSYHEVENRWSEDKTRVEPNVKFWKPLPNPPIK